MESKLNIAKKIIEENIRNAQHGIFDCPNWAGDPMYTIYDEGGLQIDICYNYEYFEVFGLNAADFAKLKLFYHNLLEFVTDD